MRSLVYTTASGLLSFAVGCYSVLWIAERNSPSAKTARPMTEERSVLSTSTNSPAPSAGATAKERIEALATISEQPEGLNRDHALAAALLDLEAADFPAGAEDMLALLKRLKYNHQAQELAEAWMDRWLELDTRGALRFLSGSPFLAQLPTSKMRGWELHEQVQCGLGGVLKALARREPEWTRQFVANTKTKGEREVGVYVLLRAVAQHDATRAERFFASFAGGADRPVALNGYVSGLAIADVRSGFDVAWAESPGPLRDELLALVFNRAGKSGLSKVHELLDGIDDPAARRKCAATALSAIGFEGREDALPFVKEESETMAAAGGWKSDSSAWAGSVEVAAGGPQAGAFAAWAADFTPDAGREMFARIVRSWAFRDPPAVRAWLSERAGTLDEAAVKRLGDALANIAGRDNTAARAWSETLSPGALRDQARFQVALGASAGDDFEQAEAAYRAVAATDAKGALASQLAEVLVKLDGPGAAQWASQQPPGPGRTAAIRTVAETWTANAPQAVAEWLEQIPAGRERDAAVQAYASRAVVQDPEAAAEWTQQVTDPALRTQTATAVFNFWSIQDAVAARAWLRNVPGIEAETVTKLLRNGR